MTAFALKMIALVCMMIDHVGAVFYMDTPQFFRFVGRVSFPVFAFLIAEGCYHTKDMKKYLARLGAFALISEIPFDLAFASGMYYNESLFASINFLEFTNVFYTLFLGALAVYFYQIICEKLGIKSGQRGVLAGIFVRVVGFLPSLLIAYAAEFLRTDYSAFGVIFILCIYIARSKTLKLVVVAAGVFYKYGMWIVHFAALVVSGEYTLDGIRIPSFNLCMLGFALLSVVCIYFYNGKRGRPLKWAFYVIYPAHLLLLIGIYYFVG